MNSIAFSNETLNEQQAKQIAEAYVKGDKDPPKMARLLGVDSFDLNLLMHPLVRRFIVYYQKAARDEYSLSDHLSKLKEIRDAAFDDDNYKVALVAETQIGKAAGLYDPKPFGDDDTGVEGVDATKLTTTELRRRLAQQIGAVIPQDGGSTQAHASLDLRDRDDYEDYEPRVESVDAEDNTL